MMPTPAARWFIAAGAEVGPLYRAWNGGAAADVPIGQLWDVVRVTTRLGYEVLSRVRSISAEIGPVLDTPARSSLEFIVAPGTAASWPQMIGTRAAATGYMRCPPPHVTVASGLRSTGARRWIVPPLYAPATTDADALCEAVAAALLTRATAVLALADRGEPR
ncbi:hypothetical protein [Streptomyces sp. NBC_01750]|uniref:hypothetical protein n=1 Tax=Streptomyces sp. NBC_01750 TaxID=2975928 RepID=UPI002DD81292|nr:hypothetical protein [Streptomyces sp. NBC_01750]WSD38155.1 hypothetical protein OG966_40615 [Streptomyces sp. NBC_01750]